ncbi:hypothetical protein R3P38DRAFT_2569505 [Favolaschia claudopus]|uniref:DUF6699 domain-containing protein n=1 Tax=Favolaschia claudopus TaxID=2862362 RepID=A0AAV9ZVN6_9AGAR
MWHGMPPLVDSRHAGQMNGIPPPAGAVMGGQPAIHSAFPGFNPQAQQQQQGPPPWAAQQMMAGQGMGGQATPWAGAGRGGPPPWAQPGPIPGPSWANTPVQPSPWPQQTPPAWAQNMMQSQPMPRQGWGPAPQGGGGGGGGGGGWADNIQTPWGEEDPWDQPQRTPGMGGHGEGFSALAAPPQDSTSGQPIGRSFFNQGGMPQGGMGQGGMHGGMQGGMGPRFAAADAAQQQWANWGQPQEQGTPGMDPRIPWGQSPQGGWDLSAQGAELVRTFSQGHIQSPKKKKKKKVERVRANSFSGGMLPQAGWATAAAFAFDANNLSRRPDDWRDGYSPRGIAGADLSLSSFFRVGRKVSADPNDWTDQKKRLLCRPLTYSSGRTNISYDLRRAPDQSPYMGNFQPRSPQDMYEMAVTPFAARMRLVHPRLPWYVDVGARFTANGITILDVLHSLFDTLNRPIAARDFWNEEMGKKDRDSLTKTYKERCAKRGDELGVREELAKGIYKVDFLGADCIFVGLVRRNGIWEIKTENNH